MAIEDRFDIPFLAGQALREKQIQQNYRPVIAVHKWFARRPGSLFRGLLLAEFGMDPVATAFFDSNSFRGKTVADPFMGGGTPLLEANRMGCHVIGFDINPMAWWIVRQELAALDLPPYTQAAAALIGFLRQESGSLYQTACLSCGGTADVKYWLWVKRSACPGCARPVDLFPGYLIAENDRHPRFVLACPDCGQLNEVLDKKKPGTCRDCGTALRVEGSARRGSCPCPGCGSAARYPAGDSPPDHRMFAIEYHCSTCRPTHSGRFFKRPDPEDLGRFQTAAERLRSLTPAFIPDDAIPAGDETNRLHRWGYTHYRQMFNARQLLGLELSARQISKVLDSTVREALATNLSDLLRYQNLLCRYDTRALKSLDVFSVHGFPVGLIACESNLPGITNGSGTNVGSGGWTNIVEKFTRAKEYCQKPFEIRHDGSRKILIPITEESITTIGRKVELHCTSATAASLPPKTLDAVLTDPPYFENVQYAELMDFCYVWLRKLAGEGHPQFSQPSTRNADELTGNETLERGLDHFTEGLALVFTRMTEALKPGAPLAFTYHHNRLEAYLPVAVAILDAGLTCTATLPCPAEMGASIHISGTASSIIDTIFVCRTTGHVDPKDFTADPAAIATTTGRDLDLLRQAGHNPTEGDTHCILLGHLVRLAVWQLRDGWDPTLPAAAKLNRVKLTLARLPSPSSLRPVLAGRESVYLGSLFDPPEPETPHAVSF